MAKASNQTKIETYPKKTSIGNSNRSRPLNIIEKLKEARDNAEEPDFKKIWQDKIDSLKNVKILNTKKNTYH